MILNTLKRYLCILASIQIYNVRIRCNDRETRNCESQLQEYGKLVAKGPITNERMDE